MESLSLSISNYAFVTALLLVHLACIGVIGYRLPLPASGLSSVEWIGWGIVTILIAIFMLAIKGFLEYHNFSMTHPLALAAILLPVVILGCLIYI